MRPCGGHSRYLRAGVSFALLSRCRSVLPAAGSDQDWTALTSSGAWICQGLGAVSQSGVAPGSRRILRVPRGAAVLEGAVGKVQVEQSNFSCLSDMGEWPP